MSPRERESVRRMEDSIMRREDGKLQIAYPFNRMAFHQRSNSIQAKTIQLRVEELLKKKGVESEYHEEMEKAIDAQALVKLSEDDMFEWKGPVHYVTHFPVINPESSSTRVRIVSNAKMPNSQTKLSFNDLVDPVPNALNELYNVLIQWRGHTTAVMCDLSKAY